MDSRDEQALRAAKLYYEMGLSQAGVATELGVSRPTVSKLLAYAREKGFVTIEVHDPRETGSELTDAFLRRFGVRGGAGPLIEVRVVQVARHNPDDLLHELGRTGAAVLEEVVQDGDRVGVSWGNTMYAVAKSLEPTPHRGVEIVQLKGGLSYTRKSTNDIETINLFCRAFDAYARTLPLPPIFDNPETKRVVEQDRHIAHLLELARETDTVIFTVGAVDQESTPLNMGYLSDTDVAAVRAKAVGDACSRFFDAQGRIAAPEVDERTVGISLDELIQRPTRVLVAGGLWKKDAIRVALDNGFATHLVIDRETAAEVLGF